MRATDRLYYTDCYLARFEAEILEVVPVGSRSHIYLDRTAFYPTSGGQPFDTGRIRDASVLDVIDEGERIAHVVESATEAGPASCEVNWGRRFDHMQQHTGQHLLSAVFVELLGYPTVSFHLGSDASTIDLESPQLTSPQVEAVEARANELVFENRTVATQFYSAEEAASIGLRKPTDRSGDIRVVEIEGCDRSACGGTHVRATGEIGPILIRRLDRVRQNVRVEFVCGSRAVRRSRTDFNALGRIAQLLSASVDQAPELVQAQSEEAKQSAKARHKLEAELAVFKGRELYLATPPDHSGLRLHQAAEHSGPADPWRPLAQHFINAGPSAVFLLTLAEPPALLLAVSSDLKLHAGNLLKSVIEPLGGRGGGSPTVAQGSLGDSAALESARLSLIEKLRS